MAGRRTNLALFALLALAFLTGTLAFGIGTGWVRWVVVAHGAIAIAIVLLAPWKSVIVQRGLMRVRRGRRASLVLSGLIVVTLLTGFAHSMGVARFLGPLSAMQVHVGAALLSLPVSLWHVVSRPTRPRRMDLSRRNLLRAGALAGGAGVAYALVEGVLRIVRLPGADRRFTGSFETGSFVPPEMPVTQWFNDSVPDIDPDEWRLVLRAGDDRTISYEELADFDDIVTATLDCTGGWFAEQEWRGVWLDRLLPDNEGASIAVTSVTGYGRIFPRRDADRLLLATQVGGAPLSPGHGFPARIVAPGRRGFWWVKWVERIEVTDRSWLLQPPFPLT
jgi:hypothetical protein